MSFSNKSGEGSILFFQKQLAEEQALTSATAERLYDLSAALAALKPWGFVGDSNLMLVQTSPPTETCYCSIMGALGEVFSLHIYVGEESFRGLSRVLAGEQPSPGEFFASHRGVSVEFIKASALTPPDRELLKHFKHPFGRGMAAPIFRALRPGYYPWYVTEPEAAVLARCMQAVVAFCETLLDDPDAPYWEEEDLYPVLALEGADGPRQKFAVRQIKAPAPTPALPVPPILDEARLGRILRQDHAVGGALEVDYFYSNARIGGKNRRQSLLPVALVTDAASGFLFQPELGSPEQSRGESLVRAVLAAIENARYLPHELRVRQKEFKILLEPAAQRLGVPVRLVKSLPALDEAKKHLLAMLEGRAGK
ncbi:MAG TPA: hypothetical protein VI488_19115 [Candidatus Angelobacter sp.]